MTEVDNSSEEELEALCEKTAEAFILRLKITKDRLKLFLDGEILPDKKDVKVTKDDLLALLKDQVDVAAMDERILEDIAKNLSSGNVVTRRRIAKGTPVTHGKDGRIVFLVRKYDHVQSAQTGTTDLRNVHSFDNLQPNTDIARIYSPVEGTPGKDVTGKVLAPNPGKEVTPKFDDTLLLKPKDKPTGFDILTAKIAGCLTEDGGKLFINDHLKINGDIDFKTGNLDFIGKISISGSVMKDFKVLAQEDLEIKGDVQGGFVQSQAGSLLIAGSIIGEQSSDVPREKEDSTKRKEKCHAKAGINLSAFSIQGASVEAEGDIQVKKEIMNSLVRTKQSLLLPEGQLLGGDSYVSQYVDGALIGSSGGGITNIHLGSAVESSSEFAQLLQAIHSHEEGAELVKLQLGPHADFPEGIQKLPEPRKTKAEKLYTTLERMRLSLAGLEAKRQELLNVAKDNNPYRLNFHKMMYIGTQIYAEDQLFCPEENLAGPKSLEYVAAEKKFVVGELQPVVKPEGQTDGKPQAKTAQTKTSDKGKKK